MLFSRLGKCRKYWTLGKHERSVRTSFGRPGLCAKRKIPSACEKTSCPGGGGDMMVARPLRCRSFLLRSGPARLQKPAFRLLSTHAPSAASPSSSVVDTLTSHDAVLSAFQPLLPYLEQLPTFFHLQSSPHAYAWSIVLGTFLLRSVVTFPVALWQRKKTEKMATVVAPAWEKIKSQLPITVAKECRRQGKNHDEYKRELQRKVSGSVECSMRLISFPSSNPSCVC